MTNNVEQFFKEIKDKKVAFCGIGKSNLPLIKMFKEKGVDVIACDSKERDQISGLANNLESMGVKLSLGPKYLENLDVDIIFRTPGMKFLMPELIEARNHGVVVTSEMEVFFDLCPCKIIAVTGSDGKTTTTTIISEILKKEGKTVHLGGNIGSPLLPKIEEIKSSDIAVVELSSFQLISMRKGPNVAVVTNVEPNHLDIHKDMNEYINAKKNLVLHQNAFSRAVLNLDNDISKNFSEHTRGEPLFFSRKTKPENGVYLSSENDIYIIKNGKSVKVMNASDIKIPGCHNIENYMAAIAAVFGNVSIDSIVEVAKTFGGVEHRAEFVREVNGVKYYNDSIASSPTRTARGTLSLFDRKIILISGGYDKKIPFDALGPIIVDKVKLLILMGQTAEKIKKAVMEASNYCYGNPEIIVVSNMEEAVDMARKYAVKGDIVSLSPSCASFDLYENFDKRGKHFKQLVNKI